MLPATFSSIVQVSELRTCAESQELRTWPWCTAAWGQGCDQSLGVYKPWNQLEALN